jgi:hypothetical protein
MVAARSGATPLLELIAEFRRLSVNLDALHHRLAVARSAALEELGRCPMADEAGNAAWWDAYRRTVAWRIEAEWDRLADRHGEALTRIMDAPAGDVAEAAGKLEVALWYGARAADGAWALEAVLRDLRVLAGRGPYPTRRRPPHRRGATDLPAASRSIRAIPG